MAIWGMREREVIHKITSIFTKNVLKDRRIRLKKKHVKKIQNSLILLFILTLVLSPFNSVFAASKASDIKGHWAENELTKWINGEKLKGYEDGTIRPENKANRAEIVTLINRVLGFSETTDASKFTDLQTKDWFYGDVAKALKAGYIKGYDDNTFRPMRETTRQEVAVMIARILDLDTEAGKKATEKYKDKGKIASWAQGAVGAVAEKGIMEGYPTGDFQPEANIKRAEVIVTLDRALAAKVEAEATVYDKAGTYGPENGTETVEGNVIVKVKDVTLQNLVITGDLLLAEGIGEGDVTLKNVTVKGTTTIQGGGPNSIHLIDTALFTVIVDKKEGNVRIVASGSTVVDKVQLDSGAKLETENMTGDGFKNVSVQVVDGEVILSGDFANVEIEVPNASVSVEKGSIENLIVSKDAKDAKIDVANGAEVGTLKLDAPTEVKGEGTIKKAEINANGSTIEKQPEEIVISDEGVSVEVDGEEVKESTRHAPPVGGGGGGSDKTNPDEMNVSDKNSLKDALNNTGIKTINITKNILDIEETLLVDRAITINGGGKTLSFTSALNESKDGKRQGLLITASEVEINNLTVQMAGDSGWQGVYGIQVYDTEDVTLEDITATGADGGILVNASGIALLGTTTVSGNEFGGIEVSRGKADGLKNSMLTVTGTLVNETEKYKEPTIWIVNDQGTVVGVDQLTTNTLIKDDQTQYYLEAVNAALDTTIKKGTALQKDDTGVYSASFAWSSVNGFGTLEYTGATQPEGRYNYYTDGAYLRFKVTNSDDNALTFGSVFEDMTLVTNASDTDVGAPVDSIKGTAGRQLEDWTGVQTAYYTKLERTKNDNYVFYGVKQTGKAEAGATRTVGFEAGESRIIDMVLTPKSNLAAGTYTVMVELLQQGKSGVIGTITYQFTIDG